MPDLGSPKRIPFDPAVARKGLFHALVQARLEQGGEKPALVDGDERVLCYDEIIRASFALGSKLKTGTRMGECPFPRRDADNSARRRIFLAALTSRSCDSPQSAHIHRLTGKPLTPRGPDKLPHDEQLLLVYLSHAI